jgi:hypothetical protein
VVRSRCRSSDRRHSPIGRAVLSARRTCWMMPHAAGSIDTHRPQPDLPEPVAGGTGPDCSSLDSRRPCRAAAAQSRTFLLRQPDSPASLDRASGLIEKQSVTSPATGRGDLDTLRPMPPIFRTFRAAASILVLRYSRDRSMLDLLLTIDDLPPGWRQKQEVRYRAGLLGGEDWDKRARRERLVGATRIFVNPETRSRVTVRAVPSATEQDVRSALPAEAARWVQLDSTTALGDEIEVTPPPEAGEHARAWLISTTSWEGALRTLHVLWPEPGALLLAVRYSARPPKLRFTTWHQRSSGASDSVSPSQGRPALLHSKEPLVESKAVDLRCSGQNCHTEARQLKLVVSRG